MPPWCHQFSSKTPTLVSPAVATVVEGFVGASGSRGIHPPQPLLNDMDDAAATGRNARRDALLGQHFTDFVPVISLIPHHRCHRRQVFAQHISTGEATALPLTQVESQGTDCATGGSAVRIAPHAGGVAGDHLLLSQTPWSLLVMPPWCHQFSSKTPTLVSPAVATVVEGFVGASGSRGIHPPQPLLNDMDDAAATGRNARRDALLGQHFTDFVPVISLIPHHRGHRRQVFAQHISTGEATALPLTQVESQGTTFYCHRPHGACWSCPLGATNSAQKHPPLSHQRWQRL